MSCASRAATTSSITPAADAMPRVEKQLLSSRGTEESSSGLARDHSGSKAATISMPASQARHPRGLAPDQPVVVTVEEPDQTQTGGLPSFHDLVTQRRIVDQADVAVLSHSSPSEEALETRCPA